MEIMNENPDQTTHTGLVTSTAPRARPVIRPQGLYNNNAAAYGKERDFIDRRAESEKRYLWR